MSVIEDITPNPLAALREIVNIIEPDSLEGPCCYDLEAGFWTCGGCDCGNFDDAAEAGAVAEVLNIWLSVEAVLRKYHIAFDGLKRHPEGHQGG